MPEVSSSLYVRTCPAAQPSAGTPIGADAFALFVVTMVNFVVAKLMLVVALHCMYSALVSPPSGSLRNPVMMNSGTSGAALKV
ncbi:hypothetical protein D3C87_1662180 [compost metagenome]